MLLAAVVTTAISMAVCAGNTPYQTVEEAIEALRNDDILAAKHSYLRSLATQGVVLTTDDLQLLDTIVTVGCSNSRRRRLGRGLSVTVSFVFALSSNATIAAKV